MEYFGAYCPEVVLCLVGLSHSGFSTPSFRGKARFCGGSFQGLES